MSKIKRVTKLFLIIIIGILMPVLIFAEEPKYKSTTNLQNIDLSRYNLTKVKDGYIATGRNDNEDFTPTIIKLDNSGKKVWEQTYPLESSWGHEAWFVDSIETDDGYVVIGFDILPRPGNGIDTFTFSKTTGELISTKNLFVGQYDDLKVEEVSDGFIVTGNTYANCPSNDECSFIGKFDSELNALWSKTWGADVSYYYRQMGFTGVIEVEDGYIAAGTYESGSSTPDLFGGTDEGNFIVKYDKTGTKMFEKRFSDTVYESRIFKTKDGYGVSDKNKIYIYNSNDELLDTYNLVDDLKNEFGTYFPDDDIDDELYIGKIINRNNNTHVSGMIVPKTDLGEFSIGFMYVYDNTGNLILKIYSYGGKIDDKDTILNKINNIDTNADAIMDSHETINTMNVLDEIFVNENKVSVLLQSIDLIWSDDEDWYLEDTNYSLLNFEYSESKNNASLPSNEEVKNPATKDNVCAYILAGIVSVLGISLFIKKKIKI